MARVVLITLTSGITPMSGIAQTSGSHTSGIAHTSGSHTSGVSHTRGIANMGGSTHTSELRESHVGRQNPWDS